MGITVSAIAETALEPARTIMRRLIWSLNDESGGIGWGAPEAMGEIMAENEALAREYYRILVSYIDENGNVLENDELERGVMWGINRLAQKRPELLREWTGPVQAQLKSPDPVKRGLALRTLLFLAAGSHPKSRPLAKRAAEQLSSAAGACPGRLPGGSGQLGWRASVSQTRRCFCRLYSDHSEIRIFQDGSFAEHKICRMASDSSSTLRFLEDYNLLLYLPPELKRVGYIVEWVPCAAGSTYRN